MILLLVIFGVLALGVGLYGWLYPSRGTTEGSALLAAVLVAMYLGHAELLGRPKPYSLEWRDGEVEVIWHALYPGRAIYLLVQTEQYGTPKLYRLPWDYGQARQLEEQARERHPSYRLMGRFSTQGEAGHNDSARMVFYAEPPAALPLKDSEDGSDTSQ